jgi:hypothetical protein
MFVNALFVFTYFFIGLLNSENKSSYSRKVQEDSAFCYIKKVFKKEQKTFIEVDYIQFLRGKEAIKAAKEIGEAEYNIDNKGDTTFFVFNDYYVLNKNKRLRIFELENELAIKLYDGIGISVYELNKRILFKVFKLKLNNQKVYNIQEIYTP